MKSKGKGHIAQRFEKLRRESKYLLDGGPKVPDCNDELNRSGIYQCKIDDG